MERVPWAFRVGPRCSRCVLVRGRQRQGRALALKVGVMWPRAKEGHSHEKRVSRGGPAEAPEGVPPCQDLDFGSAVMISNFWPPELEGIKFLSFVAMLQQEQIYLLTPYPALPSAITC